MNGDHLNHQSSPAAQAGDWQFGNQSMSMALPNSTIPMYQGIQMVASSSCPQAPMPDSFYPNPWNQHPDSQTSGFSDNPAVAQATNNLPIGKPMPLHPRLDIGMFLPTNPGMLPPSLSDFPADSSFIERAAKFSSFSAGSFSALVNPFGSPDSLSPYSGASKSVSGTQTPKSEAIGDGSMSIDHGSRCESPMTSNQMDTKGSGREVTPELANVSRDSSSKGKKRKNSNQDMELDQIQEDSKFSAELPKDNVEAKQNVECSSSTPAVGKSSGKNAKVSNDGATQDYIHVRARRGQATNSHSLAERVRRERISERMKYLQDLVPGCSKVTGKAVMLDEIINYVQSLQRQVEFLSMKLATVNPSIDLNIEGLLSKDILQSRVGPSMGFSPDLIHSQLLASQPGLVQTGIAGMVNHVDVLRRAVNAQFTAMNGLKEPTSQMSNPWEAELQNMVQMNFGANPPPNAPEFNGKHQDGFPL